jgi:predicted dehydrogenase
MDTVNSVSRRTFLKGATAAAVAGPYIMTAAIRAVNGAAAPNDRIAVGCIGVGGRGTAVMRGILTSGLDDARIVAVCDVREKARQETKETVEKLYGQKLKKATYKGCDTHKDFRELLGRKDIDAIIVATPDHWHVPVAIAAARAGKDVYVEKPLGLSVEQGRALCNAVKENRRVFQFGTQQRSDARFRQACELVRNGKIGRLQTIKVGSPFSDRAPLDPPAPLPEGFDYDLWLGPAPKAPYSEKRCVTPYWYFISDYALGYIAGWGIHHVDIAQWGNDADLSGPVEYDGKGEFPPKGELADTATAWLVNCTYANGVKMIYADQRKVRHGVTFEGAEGTVFVDREKIEAKPESLLKWQPSPNDVHLYESDHHQRNFLDCIKSRQETICPVEVAQRSDTICQLSDITIRLGRKMKWDPTKERFIGDAEADKMLSRPMRAPWHL